MTETSGPNVLAMLSVMTYASKRLSIKSSSSGAKRKKDRMSLARAFLAACRDGNEREVERLLGKEPTLVQVSRSIGRRIRTVYRRTDE